MLTIEPHAIHLWLACDEQIFAPDLLARYRELLEPEEAEKMRRFRMDRHRHQYLVTRALLRHVLALYTGTPATELRFRRTSFGKPYLAGPASPIPSFNLSHTNGRIALAIAAQGDIGVDIETQSHSPNMIDIARNYFSQIEVTQLLSFPEAERGERFLDLWTLKEAYIKACGEGLSIPLHHFSFTVRKNRSVGISFESERNDFPDHWRFWQVLPDSGHRIAIAYRNQWPGPPTSLTVRSVVPLGNHRTILPSVIESIPASNGTTSI